MIQIGDIVEIQDRTGVEPYVIDGERYTVIDVQESGTLKIADNETTAFIPQSQVKKVKVID
ncbi:hypothetical protein [Listeria booriae]|uniref:hypothetical protein n=1 Tax=Listeria booriae TaxID=1552123 RepID=UPI001629AE4B|nr:hypothetical protein [Listeria booriae]MBC1233654.1 hypothetical protein [Listeria booriae]